jgi:hypothetical protein
VYSCLTHQPNIVTVKYDACWPADTEEDAMRPRVDRVTFPSIALEYVGDIILNLLIVAGGILLLMIGVFLFAL